MKKLAYTFAEVVIAMMLVSIIITFSLNTLKQGNYTETAMKKAGLNSYLQISFAAKEMLAKHSKNYKMTSLKSLNSDIFSINDEDADEKFSQLYKKILIAQSSYEIPDDYTNSYITNEANEKIGEDLKVSDFTQGFVSKNGTYIAFKLHNTCNEVEEYIYDPSSIETRGVNHSCGTIFFDVNVEKTPNKLGVDQYIVSIKKDGIR